MTGSEAQRQEKIFGTRAAQQEIALTLEWLWEFLADHERVL